MRRAALAAVLLLCACEPGERTPDPPPAPTARAPQVGTYAGRLPCPDCEGIDTRLMLYPPPEFRFVLQRTYRRPYGRFEIKGPYYIERGSAVDPDATVFELSAAEPIYFQQVGPDELAPLDRDRRPIAGAPTLKRSP